MPVIGYICGAFDNLHTGHINILRNAKSLSDKLIVGVSTDKLIRNYKLHEPMLPFSERIEIIRSIRYVNVAIPQDNLDKVQAYYKLKYNKLFVGSDHFDTEEWDDYEDALVNFDVEVIYLPYTKGISSTEIRKRIINE